MQDPKLSHSSIKRTRKQEVLPAIPDKIYFTIGEASKLCRLKPHVLRYWEHEFPQLEPTKRRGNRRYYQRKDILLIRQIRTLLYEEGLTIEGARVRFASETKQQSGFVSKSKEFVQNMINNLEQLLTELETEV